MQVYVRGSVWIYTRHLKESGITTGTHPCIIVSSDEWNEKHGSVVVMPCTSKALAGTAKHLQLDLGMSEGNVFPTQLTTVNKSNLKNFWGKLSDEDMEQLNSLLSCILGLNPLLDMGSLIRMESEYKSSKYHLKPDNKFNEEPVVDEVEAEPIVHTKQSIAPKVSYKRIFSGTRKKNVFTVTRERDLRRRERV